MSKGKKAVKTEEGVFNLLSRGATFTAAVRQVLAESSSRLKSTPGIMYGALASNQMLVIPILDFGLAWCLNTKGFLSGRMMDIIGAEGVGKTSLVFTLFGWAMRYNIPCGYVETEGKPMEQERIKRCLHPNREIAGQMFNAISWIQSFEIVDAVDKLENWARALRDPNNGEAHVPMHIPIFGALDTFSKLMAPAEAVGYSMYEETEEDKKTAKSKEATKGRNKEKKKVIQELGGGSNFGHAKLAHAWSRRLPSLLTKYNMFLVINRHQNDDVDMSGGGGGGSFIPTDIKEQYNRKSIGGRAFAQSAAYQIVIGRDKSEFATIRGERTRVAEGAKISIAKNSYGPSRKIGYLVNLVGREDTDLVQEPTIDFSPALPDVLKSTGLLKVTINSKEVSCDELGVERVSFKELSTALHKNQILVDDLCLRTGLVASGLNFKHPPINPIFASPEAEPTAVEANGEPKGK